jgi:hypothetical protein
LKAVFGGKGPIVPETKRTEASRTSTENAYGGALEVVEVVAVEVVSE